MQDSYLSSQMKSKRRGIGALSAILILLGGVFCFQRWIAYRRNKTSPMPLQVWEGEGGQIPNVPTPSPTSAEDEKNKMAKT